jgi:CPA2 family monovalent cation:H+ antiporter-2
VGKLAWLLLGDVVLQAFLIIGFALELPRLTGILADALALQPAVARAIVLGVAAVLAAPLMVGLFRTSRALAEGLAQRALPSGQEGEVDFAAAPRRALVTTLQLALVGLSGIVLVAVTQPFLPAFRGVLLLVVVTGVFAIVFWRSAANLHGHARAGAEILAHALARTLPAGAGTTHKPATAPESLTRLMSGFGEPVAWRVPDGSPALDQTLADLNLRGSTGATVLAIHRDNGEVLLPTGRERLRSGDVLVLAGTHEAIDAARARLEHVAG